MDWNCDERNNCHLDCSGAHGNMVDDIDGGVCVAMASKEQLKLMDEWKAHTGWEFMGWDRVKSDDPQGFLSAWRSNVRWVEDNLTEADAIIKAYRDKHNE